MRPLKSVGNEKHMTLPQRRSWRPHSNLNWVSLAPKMCTLHQKLLMYFFKWRPLSDTCEGQFGNGNPDALKCFLWSFRSLRCGWGHINFFFFFKVCAKSYSGVISMLSVEVSWGTHFKWLMWLDPNASIHLRERRLYQRFSEWCWWQASKWQYDHT